MQPEDKVFGCFFLIMAFVVVLMLVTFFAIIFTGIDLAYKNWG